MGKGCEAPGDRLGVQRRQPKVAPGTNAPAPAGESVLLAAVLGGGVDQAVLVELLVEPHAADAQLGRRPQPVVAVPLQRLADAPQLRLLLALAQRRRGR